MKHSQKPAVATILLKSIVKPFYRQNAGQFIFIFILFFGAVGEIGGKARYTGPILQLEYQYALIQGMLSAPLLFALVLLAWFVYNEKCARFVLDILQSPAYEFLDILNRLEPAKLYRRLIVVQSFLFLPVSVYSIFIVGVACYKHWWLSGLAVVGAIALLCSWNAARFRRQCLNPGKPVSSNTPFWIKSSLRSYTRGARTGYRPFRYWPFFIRYAIREQKLLLAGIKLFSCGVLYFGMKTATPDNYDLRMPTLLFCIGLFGHGVLIYRFREIEEKSLAFYRGLPVPIIRRFAGYALLYGALFIPEMIVFRWLVPAPLHIRDALVLLLSGFCFLLLLNSLLFLGAVPIREYLKIVFCLFLLLYFGVLAGWLVWLTVFIGLIATGIFWRQYYQYEPGWEEAIYK